jgi:hypothetical protein
MKTSILKGVPMVVFGAFSTIFFCFSSYAETTSSDKWNFQLAPYAWLAGQNGKVATLPPLPPADIDVDFYDDILGNINGAIMLVGEARKGRYGVVMDIAYTDIEAEESTSGPFFSSVESRTKSWIVSAAGLYRLVEKERAFLDVFGGIRYWSVESKLSLEAGLLPARKISNTEDWVDPLVGLKGLTPIGESRFFVSGAFAIGGFGVGSDFMWDANINLGYQWTKSFATTFGYRYLDVDYEEDDFLYDVAQDGLVLGLSWRF